MARSENRWDQPPRAAREPANLSATGRIVKHAVEPVSAGDIRHGINWIPAAPSLRFSGGNGDSAISLNGLDEKILELYARGHTGMAIQRALLQDYHIHVSGLRVWQVTDAIGAEWQQWQNRPLGAIYPFLHLDRLNVRMRIRGQVESHSVHTAVGIGLEGRQEVLGLWFGKQERTCFWLQLLAELKGRGLKDVVICCAGPAIGLQAALRSTFSLAVLHAGVPRLVRTCLEGVRPADAGSVAVDLRSMFQADSVGEGLRKLQVVERKWGGDYPPIAQDLRLHWAHLERLFDLPLELRRAILATDAVHCANRGIQRILKATGGFPCEETAGKLTYLMLKDAQRRSKNVTGWRDVMAYLTRVYQDRIATGTAPRKSSRLS